MNFEKRSRSTLLNRHHGSVKIISAAEAMKIASHQMQEAVSAGLSLGLPTGFAELDEKTGGLYPAELTVLAAATGYGKTAFGMGGCRQSSKVRKEIFGS